MVERALRRPGYQIAVVLTVALLLTFAELQVASQIRIAPGEVPRVSLYERPASSAERMLIRGDGQQFAMLAQDPLLRRPEVLNIDEPEPEFAYRAMRPRSASSGG